MGDTYIVFHLALLGVAYFGGCAVLIWIMK
jgi:hypothetical protein